MVKSYSYQKKRNNRSQVPSNLVLRLPIALPENIDEALEDQIFSLLGDTQFDKIPVLVYAKAYDLGIDSSNGRGPSYVKVGYIKKFTVENESTGYFEVSIYNRNAENIKKFKHPAIELEYNDYNNNTLLNIVRFNVIDYGSPIPKHDFITEDAMPTTVTNNPKPTEIHITPDDSELAFIGNANNERKRLSIPLNEVFDQSK